MSEGGMCRRFLADLLRSVRGMVGAAVAAVTLYLMIVLVVVEALSGWRHPYLGLLTFLVLPPVLLVSLLVTWSGVRSVRRRRARGAAPDRRDGSRSRPH